MHRSRLIFLPFPISRSRREEGFTLLELIIVLAIIAIAGAVILPRLSVPFNPVKPPEVEFIEEQRARAIEKGYPVTVYLINGELVALPPGMPPVKPLELKPGRQLVIEWPPKAAFLDRQLITTLYPDGSTSLGRFAISQREGNREMILFKVTV